MAKSTDQELRFHDRGGKLHCLFQIGEIDFADIDTERRVGG